MGFLTGPRQEPTRAARRGSPAGALIAVAIFAVGCGGAETSPCPTGEAVEIELDAWRRELQAAAETDAAGAATYDPLLAEIGLGPLPDTTGDAPTPEDAAMHPGPVEIRPLRLGGIAPVDWLVAVRFRNAAGAEALRAQLLRPVPRRENTYCPLGDELSRDTEPHEEPCLEPHEGPARTLEEVSLVSPDRGAIVVHDAGGWCGPGARRGDRRTTAFWGVEDGRLVRYLEAVTFEAWYESPEPPTEIRRAAIELSGGWPRDIIVTETVECPPAGEPATGDCRPAERTEVYRYADGRYAPVDAAAPAGARSQEAKP